MKQSGKTFLSTSGKWKDSTAATGVSTYQTTFANRDMKVNKMYAKY